jgi:protein-S-isoprenylcysteine O-methyltransferase Ste14
MVSGPILWRRLARWALAAALAGVGWRLAGDAVSPYPWVLLAGCFAIGLYAMCVIGPDLARERLHPARAGLDDRLLLAVRLSGVAALCLGLLDSERQHWSPPMPAGVRLAGIALYLAGLAFALYAMAHNQFFSPKIRLQDDRGHHVIDTGPYAIVRHPGYAGMVLGCAALPLAIGSWWTYALMGPSAVFFLRRVGVEDRFLHANLSGYRDYAARVRVRLVPGIW